MKNEAQQFLASASCLEIVDAVVNGTGPFQGIQEDGVLSWLRANRTDAYFVVLGRRYDVAAYQNIEGVAVDFAPHEAGKWFASTLAADFPGAPDIPLQDSVEACYAVACELLGLEQLYKKEQASGHPLPRTCQSESTSIPDLLPDLIQMVRDLDKLDTTELFMKLGEENGEFAEALLVERGRLPGKVLKEPAMGEGADVFISTVCVLAKHYADMSPQDLATNLAKWVNIKVRKYSNKLHA